MDELIYNQTKIPKEKWRYGLRSSAATGCGWIATHNALRLLGETSEPEELIAYYQRKLPLLNGLFGTFFPNVTAFFRRRNFHVTSVFRRRDFDEKAKLGDVCILFFFWRQGWRMNSHYAAFSWQDGSFIGYNTYSNSTRPESYGTELESFLERQKFFLPVLIVISK